VIGAHKPRRRRSRDLRFRRSRKTGRIRQGALRLILARNQAWRSRGLQALAAPDTPIIAESTRRHMALCFKIEDLASRRRTAMTTSSSGHRTGRLRHELKDSGVTVTCLMPGATETDFFERADMLDTKIGQGEKDDPADVAKQGFKAMMAGQGDVVSGWHNKLQSAIALVTPSDMLAEQHRRKAEPGGATR